MNLHLNAYLEYFSFQFIICISNCYYCINLTDLIEWMHILWFILIIIMVLLNI